MRGGRDGDGRGQTRALQGSLGGERRPKPGRVHANMAAGKPRSSPTVLLRSNSWNFQVGEAGQKAHMISMDRPMDAESV